MLRTERSTSDAVLPPSAGLRRPHSIPLGSALRPGSSRNPGGPVRDHSPISSRRQQPRRSLQPSAGTDRRPRSVPSATTLPRATVRRPSAPTSPRSNRTGQAQHLNTHPHDATAPTHKVGASVFKEFYFFSIFWYARLPVHFTAHNRWSPRGRRFHPVKGLPADEHPRLDPLPLPPPHPAPRGGNGQPRHRRDRRGLQPHRHGPRSHRHRPVRHDGDRREIRQSGHFRGGAAHGERGYRLRASWGRCDRTYAVGFGHPHPTTLGVGSSQGRRRSHFIDYFRQSWHTFRTYSRRGRLGKFPGIHYKYTWNVFICG